MLLSMMMMIVVVVAPGASLLWTAVADENCVALSSTTAVLVSFCILSSCLSKKNVTLATDTVVGREPFVLF